MVARIDELLRQPVALRAEQERRRPGELELVQRRRAVGDERDALAGSVVEGSSGTRKMAPADARSAFEPSGSAQPSESATAAPNASAARSSVPTLPGSPMRQSARVVSRGSRGSAALR